MGRIVRDAALETRAARARLAPRGKPYYRSISPGLHLGYRATKGRRGQRVAGTWIARLYDGSQGYRVERIGVSDDHADANGKAILSYAQAQEIARGKLIAPTPANEGEAESQPSKRIETVADALADYLTFLTEKKKSADDARYRANAFIVPVMGAWRIANLTADSIEKWLIDVSKAPPRLRTKKGGKQKHREVKGEEAKRRRQSTANRTFTVLKAALNRAWRNPKNGIASDAAWRAVEPFENVDAARVRYLSLAESLRLINAADSHFRPLVIAALTTGARYGELARLEVGDFNPDSETLTVRISKSGKARHVELTAEGVAFFRSHTAGRNDARAPMFLREDGDAWGKSHQNRPMALACKRAEIVPRIGFHGLRHTWASIAVMNRTPLLVVAKNLGHKDTRMVERHYGHLAPSYIRDAIRAGAPTFGITIGNVTPIQMASKLAT